MLYTMFAFVAVFGKALAPDFLFQGHENMGPLTTRYFVSKGVSTALTFIVVHSIDDILWIPILDILSSVIALAWSFISAKRMFGTTITFVPLCEALSELKVFRALLFLEHGLRRFFRFHYALDWNRDYQQGHDFLLVPCCDCN